MKRIKKIGLVIIIGVAILGFGIAVNAQDRLSMEKQVGDMEKTMYDSRDDTVYAKGNSVDVMVNEVEQAVSFYEISGLTAQEAQEKGVEYAYERKALYQEAIDRGYQVTDAEIRAYLDELREILESDGGSEEYEMIKS